jgi:uncharacterized repeat protein (TIGR03806 family)
MEAWNQAFLAVGSFVLFFMASELKAFTFAPLLSETGFFEDLKLLKIAPSFRTYEINFPLWSDGTYKRHFIALPTDQSIGFDPKKHWMLPKGTVVIKHIAWRDHRDKDLSNWSINLESRILTNDGDHWEAATYVWRPDQTEADLWLDGGQFNFLESADGTNHRTWTVPSRAQCFECHNPKVSVPLGIKTSQMNRNLPEGNQLCLWNSLGLFGEDIGSCDRYSAFPQLSATGLESTWARAYLDVNCSQCHRPEGSAPGGMDLRFETLIENTHAFNVFPTSGNLGIPQARRIAPRSRKRSVLWHRLKLVDLNRMPPLGTSLVDETAVRIIGDWLDHGAHDP